MTFASQNPATGEVVKEFPSLSSTEIKEKLVQGQKAFQEWRQTSFAERKKLMLDLAALLKERREELGKLVTLEMGRPITSSVKEADKCAWACEHYAEHAEDYLKPEIVKTDTQKSYVRFDPLGIILAIMPWNFPFWQVIRFAAPALMAGNVGVLKHAPSVPQSAEALQQIFLDAGFPEGAFQNLFAEVEDIKDIIEDDRVKAVTLTGSERAGSIVASQAAHVIKKAVLELGGSDPFIVLSDADIPKVCEVAVSARLQNAGQSCIASKRFIIVEDRYEEFLKLYKEKYLASVVGDPMEPSTTVGPLATKDILEGIERQVEESVKMGAKVEVGGKRWGTKGFFYEPTILSNVMPNMPAYKEEIFGPVASVIKAKDVSEAIRIANDTRYGLGTSLWTTDIEEAENLIPKIEAGSVFINEMVKSDPRLPFGGIKKSGYGRELSQYGIREFVNIKTVKVKEKVGE